jgi:hypothetical protein
MAKLIVNNFISNPQVYYKQLSKLRLDSSSGIDLQGEGRPQITRPGDKLWAVTTLPWMGFGYNIAIAPIQTLTLYNSIANNGIMMRPYLVNAIKEEGRVIKSIEPKAYPWMVASPSTIKSLHAALEGVCINGTAKKLFVNSLYKVEPLIPPSQGSVDMFERFNDAYTKPRVDNIILGSGEESQQLDGNGSYGAYNGRRDGGPNILFRRDANNVSNSLTRQFMPAVALGRYPNLPPEDWPLFVIAPKEEFDRSQESQILSTASNMVKIPVDHIYKVLDIPKPKIDPETGQLIVSNTQNATVTPPADPLAAPVLASDC